MAKLIGSNHSTNFGENFFISKAQEYLDDDCIIYWNRQIFGREFDVCILVPNKGIFVVELKGWREDHILRIENSDTFIIQTESGEIKASPQRQARGYRFSIERHIKQNIGKFPLVIQLVCLPQISKDCYKNRRFDVLLENSFTILKEDLLSKAALFEKLNQALLCAKDWNRDPFDSHTMLEVRNIFETDIEINSPDTNIPQVNISPTLYRKHKYSILCYINDDITDIHTYFEPLLDEYFKGCKLYCIFTKASCLQDAVHEIDIALSNRGLFRDRDNIRASFSNAGITSKKNNSIELSFTAFHCTFSALNSPLTEAVPSFQIENGNYTPEQKDILYKIDAISLFNADQYFIEHTPFDKNIKVSAGAGTGKTFTMISRIAYICYMHKMPLDKNSDRITMITFTNEAADQMESKLKEYFQNCYLLTSNFQYLAMVSHIDHMQISTIHSYAKNLLSLLGTEFGYGIDLSITSSEYSRKRKISDLLDEYIEEQKREKGQDFALKLGMPIYAIRENILEFIEKLHNKNIDIADIKAEDFGMLESASEENSKELHALLAYIIPRVEKEYSKDLLDENKIHLSSMISILNKFIQHPDNVKRIQELRTCSRQFMCIDEFQDTDDIQIKTLMTIARLLNYKLFVVGDIKQCIYRFRGAEEKAFDQLHINDDKEQWCDYTLYKNYRTDKYLLDIFHQSFSEWANPPKRLLLYEKKLQGTRDYNGYIKKHSRKDRPYYYRRIPITAEEYRIPALVEEIHRLQKRIDYEEKIGFSSNDKEKSIAILVRENWQAEMIRLECLKLDSTLKIQTNTGGDLYMSQPALDMMTLINALLHFDEADYLYNLIISNFFNLDIPKSNLLNIREQIQSGGWRTKVDEKEQVNYLISFMNQVLVNSINDAKTWEDIIHSLRFKPILQVLRELYDTLRPWYNFSPDDKWKQHYYQLNVDLLFEQLINSCNSDHLTISTLQVHLFNNIAAQVSVNSRIPALEEKSRPIQCITVHKAKGLEYGYVILPFGSTPINHIKKEQLQVSVKKSDSETYIGYSLFPTDASEPIRNNYYNLDLEKEEKEREETRILYVAMTRAIKSFSWINLEKKSSLSWQNMIYMEE